MKTKLKLKKGDKIKVISGKHRGETGVITKVLPSKLQVLVEGVNNVMKHYKPSKLNPEGGRREKAMPIHYSNIAILDPKLMDKHVKVGYNFLEGGKKVRVSKKTGELLD